MPPDDRGGVHVATPFSGFTIGCDLLTLCICLLQASKTLKSWLRNRQAANNSIGIDFCLIDEILVCSNCGALESVSAMTNCLLGMWEMEKSKCIILSRNLCIRMGSSASFLVLKSSTSSLWFVWI